MHGLEVPTARHRDCRVCPTQSCVARRSSEQLSLAWIESLAEPIAVLPRGTPLFSVGEWSEALYTVRAGCLKTNTLDSEGNEHIRGFHLPGDLVGFDALAGMRMTCSATAVVPSQVCVTPLPLLRRLMQQQPELGQLLVELSCRELALAQALGGDYSAEQRVAAFLLRMRERLGAWDGAVLLPMPRRDIGNSLRLAVETVSRILKGFERNGWILCEDRYVRLLATRPLFELAEPVGVSRSCAPQAAAVRAEGGCH